MGGARNEIYAVIMAGGAGTRFWPASRSLRPKQLLPLGGGDEPLLAATVRRLSPIVGPDRVFVATGEHLADATAQTLPAIPSDQILKEPAPRNTAPCIAWASAVIAKRAPNAVVMVLPSDHFIGDEKAFQDVLARAIESAARGRVTTIGIVPTRPETGYGYIEVGDDLEGGAKSVVRFVEKPDRERAQAFVEGGRHLWNAGMFFFRAKDMNDLVERHQPEIARGIREIVDGGDAELRKIFPSLPNISIDHGVMEKAEGLAVVPGSFGWNDVGSWLSAWELAKKDERGNVLSEGSFAIDGTNNLVRATKTVALVGVSDLVVVETEDAVLVIPKDRAQDVRLAVDMLKTQKRASLL